MADPKDLAAQLEAFNQIEAQGQPWYKKQLPMEGRATFLPFRDTMEGSVFNQRELAMPGVLASALNAFSSPERARTGSDPTFNPNEEAINFATNVMGGGVGTSAAMKAPMGQGGKDLAMNAWHGTPHEIQGNFNLSKVGTGEGAQSYGHGMYFGGARGTGEMYRDTLAYKAFELKPEAQALGIDLSAGARGEFHRQAQAHKDPNAAASWLQAANISTRDIPKEKLVELFTKYNEKGKGNLYKVDIPDAAIPMMLDYDNPIKNQPQLYEIIRQSIADPDIRKTFEHNAEKGITGGNVYKNYLEGKTDAERSANAANLGITGIRYLDEQSRVPFKYTGDSAYTNAGQSFKDSGFKLEDALLGMKKAYKNANEKELKEALSFVYGEMPNKTSNYVVFKPETVKILEKNDKPVSRKELLQQEFDKLDK